MYAKYLTSIFIGKKGYDLSQYNVEVCTQDEIMNEIMNIVRPEECERRIMDIFVKKYKIRALKFIV